MAFDLTQLERNVRAVVAAGSGAALNVRKVIPAEKPDEPAPDGLFASVRLVNDQQVGYASDVLGTTEGGNVKLTQRLNQRATFSVQWYRAGALAAAYAFVAWLQTPMGITETNKRGLSVRRSSFHVRDIGAIVADAWEERAGIDLAIDYAAGYEYDIGRIDSADDLTVQGDTA